jgi:hypothetical protein
VGGGDKTWATFTNYSPKIKKITNLFKHTNVCTAFKNTNTLQQLTKPKTKHQNTTRVESTNFHAALAIDHILDRQAPV